MNNYMGNSRPKRVRTYSSKRSRYRKSSTGQLKRDVYSRYSRTGTPSPNRIKKPIQGKLGTPTPLFGDVEGTAAEYNLYGTSYGRLPEKEIIVELANTSDDED